MTTSSARRTKPRREGTIQVAGQKVRVGAVHARKVVSVLMEETTLTVHDGQAVMVAVPTLSTTDVDRFRAKHQVRPSSSVDGGHARRGT